MPDHDRDTEDSDTEWDGPSRSQLRREALDVLKLAQALAQLSDAQLARVPIEDDLRAEVQRARGVKQQIAHKRQTQYLAKQMRKLDDAALDAIRATLDHDRERAHRETAALHRVEHWRARLLAEGDEGINALMAECPAADRQQLRTLARQAVSERDAARPPHAQRELFRVLRELFAG